MKEVTQFFFTHWKLISINLVGISLLIGFYLKGRKDSTTKTALQSLESTLSMMQKKEKMEREIQSRKELLHISREIAPTDDTRESCLLSNNSWESDKCLK
jgi:hypothetical protein